MFSGIIQKVAEIKNSRIANGSLFLTIEKPEGWNIKLGDSIATNGTCLTVKEMEDNTYTVELMNETLQKTTFGKKVGSKVNLEPSLTLQSAIDGHLVQGHVDTVGTITKIEPVGEAKVLTIRFPSEFHKLIADKGSITVDGVSLTVVECGADWFTISLVAYTLEHTIFGKSQVGDMVNLEFDMIAKYLQKLIQK